jgi:hypothetical protein
VTLGFDVLRPDDLVALRIEARGLVLDASDAARPVLRRDPGAEGEPLLIVSFPPQTMTERALGETEPGLPAGAAEARIGGPSRLVFRLPAAVESLPYTIAGVLDWSRLEPVLPAVARVPAGQSPDHPPAIAPPAADETAIELPYRLVLAPGPEVTWTAARQAITREARTELWHARLTHGGFGDVSPRAAGTVRAVWSPDYVGPGGPLPAPQPSDEPGFSVPMSRNDRHQLVALTSDFEHLAMDLPSLGLFRLAALASPRYTPTPAGVDLLMLSALGGWLRLHGSWGGYERSERPRYADGTLLSVSGWRHIAAEGRDHFVEIVREGTLFPLGHRAAWITISERRFETRNGGHPVARLRKFSFVLVRRPERDYDPGAYPGAGREMPLAAGVRLLTGVTPHVLNSDEAAPDGRKPRVPGTGSSWVRTHDGAEFPFAAVGHDPDGGAVPFTAGMIWVPDDDSSGPGAAAKLALVAAAYRAVSPPSPVPGQSMAFAPSTSPERRDAAFPTFSLTFDVHLDGAEFLPKLKRATVRIAAVEALVGSADPVGIELFDQYVAGGLDAHAEVFAKIVDRADLELAADKAGGIATPNVTMTGVGRAAGVVAGDLAHAASGVFDPAQVFSLPDAKLFGAVPLSALILTAGGLSDAANAPRLRTSVEPGQTVTLLEWTPALAAQPAGSLLEVDPATSQLRINGRVTRPLTPGGGAPAPSSHFDGQLTAFHFVLPEIVRVAFRSFSFNADSGRKLDVSVDMAGAGAIEFLGPLAFVSGLADLIPAGIFGADGPSIDLAPDHVTVGANVALPPLPLGVFSLQHVSIGAAVTLPFFDGKPLIDVSFATREKPFLLTVTLFGGGGFVHVQLDSDGVRMVEGSLEFGGAFALDIGVASGGVQVMAGIYFKLSSAKSVLGGFVDLSGEVSVLGLISISVEFNLTLSYESPGKARGKATLSVAIHIAFISKSVELSVERSFGSEGSDPTLGDVMGAPEWAAYAKAFA